LALLPVTPVLAAEPSESDPIASEEPASEHIASESIATQPVAEQASAISAAPATSDASDSKDASTKLRITGVPVVFYTPETSVGIGAMGISTFRLDDSNDQTLRPDGRAVRRSSALLFASYTFKNQFIVAGVSDLFFARERYNFLTVFDAAWFPDRIYPIGPESDAELAERYDSRRFLVGPSFYVRLWRALGVGLAAEFRHIDITKHEPLGLFDDGSLPGAQGGRRVGVGPRLRWDTRDNNITTYSGTAVQLGATFYESAIGSAADFGVYLLDARQFWHFGSTRVLGVQATAQLSSGNVPFDRMATLGGPSLMRGFFQGRFRDENSFALQTQYTEPLFWRLSAALFAGAAEVMPRVDAFRFDRIEVAGGGGLRLLLNQEDHINLRLDVATTSTGDTNGYFHMVEAF
jgi:hypothetical protein